MPISYNNKTFRSVSNTESGEVSGETVFQYYQEGRLVHGVYKGGDITFGTLIAKADNDGMLDMLYQHLNRDGELKTGKCVSTPELLDDGRIRLHEKWQWTCGGRESGDSILEEVRVER